MFGDPAFNGVGLHAARSRSLDAFAAALAPWTAYGKLSFSDEPIKRQRQMPPRAAASHRTFARGAAHPVEIATADAAT